MTRFSACKSCRLLWAKFSGLHTDQCSSADLHWVRIQTVNLSALVPSVPSSRLSRDLLQIFTFYHLQTKKRWKLWNTSSPNFSKHRLPLLLVILKFTGFFRNCDICLFEEFFFKCHSSKIKTCFQIIEACQGNALRSSSTARLCAYLDLLTANDQHLTICGNF